MVQGDTGEQGLIRYLDDAGFAVTKSPASGGGTTRDQPDVVAAQRGSIYVFEVKAGEAPVYVGADDDCERGDEVGALLRYGGDFGAHALIAYRPPGRVAYHLFSPRDLHDSGQHRVVKDTTEAVGLLDDVDSRDGWTADDVREHGLGRLLAGAADA